MVTPNIAVLLDIKSFTFPCILRALMPLKTDELKLTAY